MTRDPGLQPERTRLAWQRTGVAGVLVGAAATVASARRDNPVVLLLAALACLVVAVATVAGAFVRLEAPYARLVLGAAAPVALAVVGAALALS